MSLPLRGGQERHSKTDRSSARQFYERFFERRYIFWSGIMSGSCVPFISIAPDRFCVCDSDLHMVANQNNRDLPSSTSPPRLNRSCRNTQAEKWIDGSGVVNEKFPGCRNEKLRFNSTFNQRTERWIALQKCEF